jgi:tetratricopeptide (TPR) repeat protein
MNEFMHKNPEFAKLESLAKNAADLFKQNKFLDSSEVYSDIIRQYEELPAELKNENPEFSESFLLEVRERLSECRFKLEDYDSAIEEGLKVLEKRPIYEIYLRVGISFFKKGKYYKARDNLLKAKELFTGEPEKIRKKICLFTFSSRELPETNLGHD